MSISCEFWWSSLPSYLQTSHKYCSNGAAHPAIDFGDEKYNWPFKYPFMTCFRVNNNTRAIRRSSLRWLGTKLKHIHTRHSFVYPTANRGVPQWATSDSGGTIWSKGCCQVEYSCWQYFFGWSGKNFSSYHLLNQHASMLSYTLVYCRYSLPG